MKRAILLCCGWLSVALAILGAVLPLLPCTPFVLLAAACFTRSSPWAMRFLHRSPLLGPVLTDWQQHRGLRPLAKLAAVLVAIAAPLVTFAVGQQLNLPLLISTCGGLIAIGVVCRLPTIRPESAADARKLAGPHRPEKSRAAA